MIDEEENLIRELPYNYQREGEKIQVGVEKIKIPAEGWKNESQGSILSSEFRKYLRKRAALDRDIK